MSEDVSSEKTTPWHDKRWLVIAAIFFTVVSMVVVGISVAAHMAWQASPEKALVDAFEFSSKTPATYKVATKDLNMTVSYDGKRQAANGAYKSVRFNAIVDGTTLYLKSETPEELVKLFTPRGMPDTLRPAVDAATTKITNKWVSLSLEQLPLGNASQSRSISCMTGVRSQLASDKDAKKELTKIYENNRFLNAEKTATTEQSNAYKLTVNDATFGNFASALKGSSLYRSQKTECGKVVQSVIDAQAKRGDAAAEVMLSKSKNALQKATLTDTDGAKTTIDVNYGDVGTIVIPSEPVSYDEITNGIVQTVVQSYLNNR